RWGGSLRRRGRGGLRGRRRLLAAEQCDRAQQDERRDAMPAHGRLSSLSRGGNLQDLSWMDEVGILDDVAVGVEDPPPFVGVAVELFRDLRQAVAGGDGVRLLGRLGRLRGWRRRRAAGYHIRKVG